MPVVRCLSMHAGYRCQRTGACCSSNWPVPVEADRLWRLETAVTSGELAPVAGTPTDAFAPPPPGSPPSVASVLGRDDRRCVFLESGKPSAGDTCRVHRDLGHDALPLSCRQFPRVSVQDPRGVSITLSHYCPTAAAMLSTDEPIVIVSAPAGFPEDGEYDALDASMAMPPLLQPDMLMDWNAWWEWERLAIALLAKPELGDRGGPALALGRLRVAVERLREWRPADGPLIGHVRTCLESATHADVEPFAPDGTEIASRVREVVDATPPDVAAAHEKTITEASAETPPATAVRFLAAHAFGSWPMQLGQGLRTWLRSLEAADALLRAGLDVRHADLWLRHLADGHALAKAWSRTEQ